MKRFFIIFSLTVLSSLFFISFPYAQGLSYENQNEMIFNDHEVLIYPNPITENKFYVKSESIIGSIEVLNVIGQSITKLKNNTDVNYNILVRLPNCDKGMYMIKIIFKDNTTVIRKVFVK